MSRPSIALCMIVKNEEQNLPRVFESVEGLFDEIHITDTGSTDNTVAVAEAHGAKVSHFKWIHDFAAARNFNFSQAKTDYILWMDGDDTFVGRESFLHFRDEVMKVADYWVAPYHYATDDNGKVVCNFIRERVVKRSKNFKWSYFIHEGMRPESPQGPVMIQAVRGWHIKHMRTSEDLAKDTSRNLKIFEMKMKEGPLDARMRYYLGKEYFENQRPKDAISALGSAVSDPGLELHDRILAMQYLATAYAVDGNHQKSLEIAHTAMLLDPNRSEFHCQVGDAYIKMGRPQDALVFYNSAKACRKPHDSVLSPIFFSSFSYEEYPRNQIARVYANMGDMPRARREAVETVEAFNNQEARDILLEIDRYISVDQSYKDARPCDDIVFLTPPQTAYEFDPGVAEKRSMGGSETALIEMAYWMKKLSGRPVKVFNMRSSEATFDGVEYIPNAKIADYMAKHKPWLNINWRHTIKLTYAPTFIWSHDLVTQGAENVDSYVKILALTPWHKKYLGVHQNIPADKIWVTRNGLKPERFQDGPWEKDPWKFVFSSSPDRGLDRAMRVLDKVRETFPKVHLHVAYGIEHLPQWGHQQLHDVLKQMMEERKEWVTYEGAMQQNDLMALFKKSAYCVQPSDFLETSMISAMERAACGVYQILRNIAGGADTLSPIAARGMAELVDSDCITEEEHQVYVDATLRAIASTAYNRVNVPAGPFSWKHIAQEWLEELPRMAYGDEKQIITA